MTSCNNVGDTIFRGHSQHMAFLGEYIVYTFFSLCLIGVPLLMYRYLRTVTTCWEITTERIESHTGILSKNIESLEMWRIVDVRFTQTILDRILGEANVVLSTTDQSTPELILRGLPRPLLIYQQLKKASTAARVKHGVVSLNQ